jgi:hypothetical protein
MIENRQHRVWLMVAAIAIVAALVLMLIPHGHAGNPTAWLAILPVVFIGLITPLNLSSPLAAFDLARAPEVPAFRPSFQRPPPIRLT